MKTKFRIIIIVICCVSTQLFSQNPDNKVSNLKSSWIGNSFPGGAKWVQHNIQKAQVDANGEIHVYSNWDEARRPGAKYQGIKNPDGSWYGDKIGHQEHEDAFANVSGDKVTIDGVEWYIEGYIDTHRESDPGRLERWGKEVKKSGTEVVISDLEKATSLGIDRLNNLLMVTDDGPTRKTVRFYDTDGQFVKEIGVPGGVWPENVGGDPSMNGVIDTELKFWDLVGCGTDSTGNIIVVMSDIWKQSGVSIKAFNPSGEELLWELHADPFCDVADFDRDVDGTIVYGPMSKFQMDYTKPVGKQYTKVAHTLNPHKYPNDWRLSQEWSNKNLGSSMVRYVQGVKFLYYTGMYGGLHIYKFNPETDGEIAIPSQELFAPGGRNHLDVHDNGDVYELLYTDQRIRKTPALGVDSNGDIIWGAQIIYDRPSEFSRILGCSYVGGPNDEMLVGGFFPGDEDQTGWKHVGKRMVKYANWNANPTMVWSHHFESWYHMDDAVAHRRVNKSMHAVGDYVFVDWGNYNYNGENRQDSPGVIDVFSLNTGEKVGEIFAGPEVMNQSSWHDLLISFHIMQRSNGEYLVLSEENWKSKYLLFQWCPTGNCPENGYIRLNTPIDGAHIAPGDSVSLGVDLNTTLDVLKVEYLADSIVIAEAVVFPYIANYSFTDESIVNLSARFISSKYDTINSINSSRIYVYRPHVDSIIISPRDTTIFIGDSIFISYEAFDQFHFQIETTPSWSVSEGASISEDGWFKSNGEIGDFMIIAFIGSVADTIIIAVNKLDILTIKIYPLEPFMHVERELQLRSFAYDQSGGLVDSVNKFEWQVISGQGDVDEMGLFTAGDTPGMSRVVAIYKEKTDTLSITILPKANWVNKDIGPVGIKGGVLIDDEKDEFTVTASGSDIWGNSDEFHYVFRPLFGDGQISARVDGFNNTHPWTKTGVMIRERISPSSAHVSALITSANGLVSLYRLATGGGSDRSAKLMVEPPYWMKVSRSGNVFTTSESTDGIIWNIVQELYIPMADTVLIGLAATSHDNDSLVTIKYSNVVSSGFDLISLTGITLNMSSIEMYPEEQFQLQVYLLPENTTLPPTIEWSSSDEGVATVDKNGLITAMSEGSVTITATTLDGNHMASCRVHVLLTSVSETYQNLNLKLYPNPLSNGNLTIHVGCETLNAAISVHSIAGQLIYKDNFSGISREISGDLFKKGVYIIALKTNQGTYNKLFIKQ